jgi:hypothetical protein
MKMKFGHHGANHPVKDLDSGKVLITSQNHGFAVDPATCRPTCAVTHVSLFDGSCRASPAPTCPAFCFQGHPEASPGPHDVAYLFDRFIGLMEGSAKKPASGSLRPAPKSTRATAGLDESPRQACPNVQTSRAILIIGAGPIVIGQACEFDYSGAQACKALREEGYRVILVNSNPATIMTDPEMADATYIEPITWQVVEKHHREGAPDALLPTMGGQTALNCALDLAKHGVLDKYGVEMIGANARRSTRPRTARSSRRR